MKIYGEIRKNNGNVDFFALIDIVLWMFKLWQDFLWQIETSLFTFY